MERPAGFEGARPESVYSQRVVAPHRAERRKIVGTYLWACFMGINLPLEVK
ncbi:hypothetical protein ES703_46914 [subsurface metagenome]